ncbi:MAG: heavy-metal-associated domain-containing protein [Planctomycetota bacterium]|jgi:copper chaperone CopZ|nr:heavy-metal-associated domain-containing protein [Planctomycetaceae bacterium]MCE2812514.1 heavy-metal-associated domain-containing protein [Planctomycetaceae bacterium]
MSVKLRLICLVALSASVVVFPGCESSCNQSMPSSSASTPNTTTDQEDSTEPKLVSFKVDGMTCPSGCYPSVKSAIAKQKGVVEVELAPQKESDVIDNPVVFVKYKGKLDLDSTIKAISRAGFEAQEVSN